MLSFSTFTNSGTEDEKLIDDVEHLLAQAGYSVMDEKAGESSQREMLPRVDYAYAKHLKHCAACRDDSLLESIVVAQNVTPLTLKTELSIEGMTCA